MAQPVFVPHPGPWDPGVPPEEAARRFHDVMARRRSVRAFSGRPVSRETVEWLVRTAAGAPSGANKQPWRFVCVQDRGLKREIRRAAEEEEREFYARRAGEQWLKDLEELGTDEHKEFLEVAPWLIVVFRLTRDEGGGNVYYSHESVGIAVGFLLAAAQHAGLATLTHTPNPMRFLGRLLGRPAHERPYVLIPIGFPAEDCVVPEAALRRKPLEEVLLFDAPAGTAAAGSAAAVEPGSRPPA